MPTQAALDIVNALFAGKKDVSDYVATGMKTTAVDAIDARKAEVGKTILAPGAPEEEEVEQPEASTETETEVKPEESTDETDQEEIETAKVLITEGKDGKKNTS
ncbi:MAG: hypothetical protein CM15mV6_2040 [uncultured marine virus]|nr:MAG: hypothetical protein CM15mV6_2040 [uncultured marine virus]